MPAPEQAYPIRLLARPELDLEVTAFLIDRQARGLSARTIAWYGEQLRPFVVAMAAMGVDQVRGVTADVLRRYLIALGDTEARGDSA